jgi:hypothetical protein
MEEGREREIYIGRRIERGRGDFLRPLYDESNIDQVVILTYFYVGDQGLLT